MSPIRPLDVPVLERRAARGAATFDPTGIYRYQLLRIWEDSLPRVCWVMLNPSTATATVDDPTISRVVAFSRRWGYGSAVVVNLFAIRTPNPREVRRAAEPVGPDNDRVILRTASGSDDVIIAWGNHGAWANPVTGLPRCEEVQSLLTRAGVRVAHLGLTKSGQPRHPLHLPASTTPTAAGQIQTAI